MGKISSNLHVMSPGLSKRPANVPPLNKRIAAFLIFLQEVFHVVCVLFFVMSQYLMGESD